MKQNVSLHIFIGLLGLGIASFFIHIEQSVIVFLSFATLLFTISQTINSYLNYKNEDLQKRIDTISKTQNLKLSEKNAIWLKKYVSYSELSIGKKILSFLSDSISSIAFVILFIGFVVPVQFPEDIGNIATILSTAMLFLGIFMLDKQQYRKTQWEELIMLYYMGMDEIACTNEEGKNNESNN